MNKALKIAGEHQRQMSNNQLILQWQILEGRKKFLIERIHRQNETEFEKRIENIDAWIGLLRTEMENRIDRMPIEIFYMLIESDFSFSILG